MTFPVVWFSRFIFSILFAMRRDAVTTDWNRIPTQLGSRFYNTLSEIFDAGQYLTKFAHRLSAVTFLICRNPAGIQSQFLCDI